MKGQFTLPNLTPPPDEASRQRNNKTTRGVLNCGLTIYSKKYLKAEEELWKFKYNLQKKSFTIS
jgi:hypothetical protein